MSLIHPPPLFKNLSADLTWLSKSLADESLSYTSNLIFCLSSNLKIKHRVFVQCEPWHCVHPWCHKKNSWARPLQKHLSIGMHEESPLLPSRSHLVIPNVFRTYHRVSVLPLHVRASSTERTVYWKNYPSPIFVMSQATKEESSNPSMPPLATHRNVSDPPFPLNIPVRHN